MEYIIRIGEPSKLDHAPFGTLCKIIKGDEIDIYRQTSHNEEDPVWIYIETIIINH